MKRIQMLDDPRDLFAGIPDLSRTMYGCMDYLSLCVRRYGLREMDIVASDMVWYNEDVLQFRFCQKNPRSPISPAKYDRRLPDSPFAFIQRIWRVRYFMARCLWFRSLCRRIDDNARGWMDVWSVEPEALLITARWASNGIFLIKFIHPKNANNPNAYMTHYKRERA